MEKLNRDVSSPAEQVGAFGLPFRGRAESFQLLGLGSLAVARQLCAERDLSPVAFDGERALFQLSFMNWWESSVGPYCASFAGPVVEPAAPRAPSRRPSAREDGRAVLAAFLSAPKSLFVPVYAIGQAPQGTPDSVGRSHAFGRSVLGIDKTRARFNLKRAGRLTHLQVLEERISADGGARVSGFALSISAGKGDAAVRTPISPNLLLSRALYWESAKAMWQGGTSGVMHMPAHTRPADTIPIGTHFSTRPRLVDLAADPRASFTPLVLDRPAPSNALGLLLEAAEFSPRILLWDPELRGSILGRLDRIDGARGEPLAAVEQGAA